MSDQPGFVLMVEDDPGDQELARRAMLGAPASPRFCALADGEEALDFLLQRGKYEDPDAAPRPDLVLLDLNLPGMPGLKLLEAMKESHECRTIPVVVLSTSARRRDIDLCYQLGCNAYVVKPLEAHQFMSAVQEICRFWFKLVALPSP